MRGQGPAAPVAVAPLPLRELPRCAQFSMAMTTKHWKLGMILVIPLLLFLWWG